MIKPKINSIQKHRFEEERARQILIYCIPDKYQNAELSDAPDIIVSALSIGVEVTECVREYFQENISRACSITGKVHSELSKHDIENIREQRVFAHALPNGQYVAGTILWGDQYDLATAYSKKLKKLNGQHFMHFEENNLFIFAWMIDEDELSKGVSAIKSLHLPVEYKYCFDNIYIFKEALLVHIHMKDQSINYFTVPLEVMTNISEDSFKNIIGVTRDEYFSH